MARSLRIEFPGTLYHLTARGNAQQPIFLDDQDRCAFLHVLEKALSDGNGICHADGLMTSRNHLPIGRRIAPTWSTSSPNQSAPTKYFATAPCAQRISNMATGRKKLSTTSDARHHREQYAQEEILK